jgi:biotin-dependent carboxylase-like uncharacterized protein
MTDFLTAPRAEVIAAGVSMTLQDAGRLHAKKYGVPQGGAMDQRSMHQANRLLENLPDAAVYEIFGGGVKLRCLRHTWIALTGAGRADIDGSPAAFHRTIHWQPTQELHIHSSPAGIWTYLSSHHGWQGEIFLGSRSVWPQANMGRKCQAGDILRAQSDLSWSLPDFVAARFTSPSDLPPSLTKQSPTPLRCWPGPQWQQFDESTRTAFFESIWHISLHSNRAGFRLDGLTLPAPSASMPSEPIILGSIQVPPSGSPIILLNDGPTIGGYPKIALIHRDDLDTLRQLPPLTAIQLIPACLL